MMLLEGGYAPFPSVAGIDADWDYDRNYETLDKLMTEKRVGIYAGVDPTAPSLHVGHMVPFMVLGWAYIHGIKSVFLVSLLVGLFQAPRH